LASLYTHNIFHSNTLYVQSYTRNCIYSTVWSVSSC
jgi:hypothetical protein